jgi:hypothetical protein
MSFRISIKNLFFLFSALLIFTLLRPQVIYAIDSGLLLKPKIIPGTFQYNLERAWEKVYISFIFSNKGRVKYYNHLLDKRLSELNYLVETKDLSNIENSSYRFSYQAGVLAEALEFEDNNSRLATISKFKDYSSFLEKLRDEFPANSSNWLLIQQNIDTLKILSEKLQKE